MPPNSSTTTTAISRQFRISKCLQGGRRFPASFFKGTYGVRLGTCWSCKRKRKASATGTRLCSGTPWSFSGSARSSRRRKRTSHSSRSRKRKCCRSTSRWSRARCSMLYDRSYHSALTGYFVMRGSGVRMTSPPAIAWQTRMRSNGSL